MNSGIRTSGDGWPGRWRWRGKPGGKRDHKGRAGTTVTSRSRGFAGRAGGGREDAITGGGGGLVGTGGGTPQCFMGSRAATMRAGSERRGAGWLSFNLYMDSAMASSWKSSFERIGAMEAALTVESREERRAEEDPYVLLVFSSRGSSNDAAPVMGDGGGKERRSWESARAGGPRSGDRKGRGRGHRRAVGEIEIKRQRRMAVNGRDIPEIIEGGEDGSEEDGEGGRGFDGEEEDVEAGGGLGGGEAFVVEEAVEEGGAGGVTVADGEEVLGGGWKASSIEQGILDGGRTGDL